MPLLDLSDTISDLIPKQDVLYRPVGDQGERYLGNSPLMLGKDYKEDAKNTS